LRIDSHVCLSASHPPEHLQAILARNRFDGAILMVDGMPLPETGPHVAGIVCRGVEPLGEDARCRGVCAAIADVTPAIAKELARRGWTLDVEMRPGDFRALVSLAESVPALRIAIDHLGRPAFAQGITEEWAGGMEAAARLPNVVCKISGLLSEVALPWKAEAIRPFVQHALAVFGPRRAMFGSEWPVRLPDVTWKESLAAFTQSIGAQTMETREQLLGGTAAEFYRL
jgi:predicted TIM-barrel fold metal-dependent hydrolase